MMDEQTAHRAIDELIEVAEEYRRLSSAIATLQQRHYDALRIVSDAYSKHSLDAMVYAIEAENVRALISPGRVYGLGNGPALLAGRLADRFPRESE